MLVVNFNILNQLIKKKMKEKNQLQRNHCYHILQLLYIRFAFGRSKMNYGHTKNADKLS